MFFMFYCLFFSKYTSSLLDFQVHFKCTLVPSVNWPIVFVYPVQTSFKLKSVINANIQYLIAQREIFDFKLKA